MLPAMAAETITWKGRFGPMDLMVGNATFRPSTISSLLADALEIPNLGTRSNKYLGYLCQRYLFGVKDADSPADTAGERAWLAAYGIAAFLYRMFIMFVIIMFINFITAVTGGFTIVKTDLFETNGTFTDIKLFSTYGIRYLCRL